MGGEPHLGRPHRCLLLSRHFGSPDKGGACLYEQQEQSRALRGLTLGPRARGCDRRCDGAPSRNAVLLAALIFPQFRQEQGPLSSP